MNDWLKRYPKNISGGLMVRPMQPSDEAEILSFYKKIPVDERQLFREDVTDPAVIQGWVRNLDYGRVLSLFAFLGPRIVADATLHRDSGGWARHLGRVRLTIDPDFRRQGLARLLMKEFIDLAKPLAVAILEAEVLDVQKQAGLLFEDMGFQCVATLQQHEIDLKGRVHDTRLFAQMINLPEGLAPEAKGKEADADVGGVG